MELQRIKNLIGLSPPAPVIQAALGVGDAGCRGGRYGDVVGDGPSVVEAGLLHGLLGGSFGTEVNSALEVLCGRRTLR